MTNELPETRASDAERERVAEVLREAVAEGRLDMDEFDERLDRAYRARTHGELQPLLRDLPQHTASVAPAPRSGDSPTRGGWAGRIGGSPTARRAIGLLGGFVRRGPWTVPARFPAFAFWGGGQIDLRDARFAEREVVIRCTAIMGGIQVIAPLGAEVEVRGIGIMGGFDQTASGEGEPGAPRIVVTGFALWGGVGTERKRGTADRERDRDQRRLSGPAPRSLDPAGDGGAAWDAEERRERNQEGDGDGRGTRS